MTGRGRGVHSPSWDTIMRCGMRDGRNRVRSIVRWKLTRIGLAVMAVVLAVLLALVWWTGGGRRESAEAGARAECASAVSDMRAAYEDASKAHDAAAKAFATLDSGRYDLDRLQKASDASLPTPSVPSCSTDPDLGGTRARSLTAEYRRLAREWSQAAQAK